MRGVVGASEVLPLKKVGGWGASFSHPPFKRGGGGGGVTIFTLS